MPDSATMANDERDMVSPNSSKRPASEMGALYSSFHNADVVKGLCIDAPAGVELLRMSRKQFYDVRRGCVDAPVASSVAPVTPESIPREPTGTREQGAHGETAMPRGAALAGVCRSPLHRACIRDRDETKNRGRRSWPAANDGHRPPRRGIFTCPRCLSVSVAPATSSCSFPCRLQRFERS
jgi:hypothetical protein